MLSIWIKELGQFFSSLTGYIAILLFLIVTGIFLFLFQDSGILESGYASLDKFFELAPWVLLFLIPADSQDHKKEFNILVNELKEYNPELLDKKMIIAVSKSDMLDDELKEAIEKELPKKVPHIFISSITQHGLTELKDMLWKALN